METIHPPPIGRAKTEWKTIKRRPLQPRNAPVNHSQERKRADQKKKIRVPSDKENWTFWQAAAGEIEPIGASLAEELDAVRRRLERLRAEKEKTDAVLRQRGLILERGFKEMEMKDEELKKVQVEMDRILKLKTLRFSTTNSVKSLREQEQEKRMKLIISQEIEAIKEERLTGQNSNNSSCKASLSSKNPTEASTSSNIIEAAVASISYTVA